MKNVVVVKDKVNSDALDAALRAAFGKPYLGVSCSPGRVTVYFEDSATLSHEVLATRLVSEHDPVILTAAQQEAHDRDKLPLFTMSPEEILSWASDLDNDFFRREIARAFVLLRDLVRG